MEFCVLLPATIAGDHPWIIHSYDSGEHRYVLCVFRAGGVNGARGLGTVHDRHAVDAQRALLLVRTAYLVTTVIPLFRTKKSPGLFSAVSLMRLFTFPETLRAPRKSRRFALNNAFLMLLIQLVKCRAVQRQHESTPAGAVLGDDADA
jgi:hypothetical protein